MAEEVEGEVAVVRGAEEPEPEQVLVEMQRLRRVLDPEHGLREVVPTLR